MRASLTICKLSAILLLNALLLVSAGCNTLLGLIGASQTTVRLVNNGDFPIRVEVVYSSDQNLLKDVLEQVGTSIEFTISAGQTAEFSRDCDDLQAVAIRAADLQLVGSIGPETDSDVERDGSDFGCGDTIEFTFDHGPLLLDFNVTARTIAN